MGGLREAASGNEFRTREREEGKVCTMWIDRIEKRYSNIGLRVKISVTCLHNHITVRIVQKWNAQTSDKICEFASC